MNPWKLLGLDADADTRSIKRRYAQLLKQHRPDEDPEAFQRLREAYEYAMQVATAKVDEERHEPFAEPLRLVDGRQVAPVPESEAPALDAAPAGVDTQRHLGQLLSSAASMDDALRAADAEGLQAEFQRYLLARCAIFDEQGLSILRWGMQRLHWLSPWQADYLPQIHTNALAMRLLALELEHLQQRLQAGEERAVLEHVTALVANDWLQPFDRRLQLQDGLVDMLESSEQWSAALFERLTKLFGWDEDKGELPCSLERWAALCWYCERQAVGEFLQRHLNEVWPGNAEQRAAWLLLKAMDERECRRLVDRFDDNDWLACEALDELLNERYPGLTDLLGVEAVDDWRRWQPRQWAAPAAAYAWMMLFAAMLANILFGSASGVVRGIGNGAFELALKNLFSSLVLTGVLVCLARSWGWLVRFLISFDMPLSRLLLPASWRDCGAGMLLLRHGVPATVLAGLVALFAPARLEPLVVFVAALTLQLLFLGLVGSRRQPWPRLAMFRSGLFKIDYSRKAEW